MGTLTRATRNMTRRKARALLVIIALSLALAMIISIPPSITASQQATQKTIDNLTTATQIVTSTVNMAATEIDCSLPLTITNTGGPYHNETTLEQPLMNTADYSNLTAITKISHIVPILIQTADNWQYQIYGIP
jgi:hypothetical protein